MLSGLDKHSVWSDARPAQSASDVSSWPAPSSASAPMIASTDTAHRPRSDPTEATSGNASDGSSTSRGVNGTTPVEEGANLFVAGLPPSVDDEAFEAAFAKFGPVLSAKVMLHVDTAVSRGFGFVLFRHAADAATARAAMHGHAIEGHAAGERLTVSVSRHKGENLGAESRVVYVRNVPVCISRERLTEVFGEFGEVAKLQVKATRTLPAADTDSSRDASRLCPPATLANFVVEFATSAAARRCVSGVHNKRLFAECRLPLLAKIEEPHDLRDKRRNERLAAAADAKEAMLLQPVPSVQLPAAPKPPQNSTTSDAPQTQTTLSAPASATPPRQESPAPAGSTDRAQGNANHGPGPTAAGAPWPSYASSRHAYDTAHALYHSHHHHHHHYHHSAYAPFASWLPPLPLPLPPTGAPYQHPPGGPSPTPGLAPRYAGYPPPPQPATHAFQHAWHRAAPGAYAPHPPASGHVVTHVYYGAPTGYSHGY